MLTRADKVLVGLVFLIALAGTSAQWYWFGVSSAAVTAEIRVDGKLVKTMWLRPGYREKYRLIGAGGHYNVIEADEGRIRVQEADCPDQDCVRFGWITKAPEQIVCLPAHVSVKIVSVTDVDEIAR